MSNTYKSIHVIANPVAGQDDTLIAALNDAFHNSPLSWEISVTHQYGDGARLARKAINDGADLIGVYGGDGTIGDVLNGVHPCDIPLVILSGGTGNGAAKVLGIPSDLTQSAQYVANGNYELIKTDIGRINDRLFLLRVDIGKIVEVVKEMERQDKDDYGILTYHYAIGRTFVGDNDIKFRFTIDDNETVEREGAAFILLNLRLKSEDDHATNIQSGMFDFFLLRSNLWEAAKGVAAFVDLFETDNAFEVFSAQKIRIDTPEPLTVLADGEPCGQTPLELQLLPQAVTLVVPK